MSTLIHSVSRDFWSSVDDNEEFYTIFKTFKRAIITYICTIQGAENYDKITLITPYTGEYERRALATYNGNPGYKATNAGIRNFKNNFAMKIELIMSEL